MKRCLQMSMACWLTLGAVALAGAQTPGGKQGSLAFKEGGPQERAQGEKGKPGGPQGLKLSPGSAANRQLNTLDPRARPNAGVTGRPQAQQMPAADALKAVPQ